MMEEVKAERAAAEIMFPQLADQSMGSSVRIGTWPKRYTTRMDE